MTKYYPVHKLLRRVLYYNYKKENSLEKQNSMKKKKKLAQGITQSCCLFSVYLVQVKSGIMEKLKHPNFQKVSRNNPSKNKNPSITPNKLMENMTEHSFI